MTRGDFAGRTAPLSDNNDKNITRNTGFGHRRHPGSKAPNRQKEVNRNTVNNERKRHPVQTQRRRTRLRDAEP